MHIGIGRILYRQVVGLDDAKLFEPAGGDAEFVGVDKYMRLEFVDHTVQRARLRQVYLDVVTIDVDGAVGRAPEVIRAVRV